MSGKRETLKSKIEIRSLFQEGIRLSSKSIRVILRRNHSSGNRFLFCSDKTSKNSVQRNRTKRVLRVLSQDSEIGFPEGYDIALVAGKEFSDMKLQDRKNILSKVLSRFHGE
ncbi:MAG: ribonuclease P protein component [Leptospiraceae bacterium]|nr:ribonuclease P protein component [Leptospiraceae bacterium]MCP5513594.1 ribonuclease P protein component [Leptospiraceae bacterium]